MSECVLFTGRLNRDGYGQEGHKSAHRLAYERATGRPISPEFEIDHLCRVRSCVNPDHLETVTHAENMRRAWKDRCHRGHPYDDRNTYTPESGTRNCRPCNAESARRYRARVKQA